MNWHDLDSIYSIALTQYNHGRTIEECAVICNCGVDDIKKLFKKYGTGKHSYAKEIEPKVIELLKGGYTTKEIADMVGLSEGWVYKFARQNDISPETEVKRERDRLIAFVQQYKAKGMTAQEISKQFGINISFARKYGKGINSQSIKPLTEREEEAQRYIAEHFDNIEYAGGYVHSDSPVMVRCLKCGTVFERSMITLRHQTSVTCPTCTEELKQEAKRRNEVKKRERQEGLRLKRERETQERAERRKEEAERKKAEKLHPCPVCGTPTTRNKYCSQRCANRVINAKKEAKRRAKIDRVLVDKDISLYKLYKRDHGICYLCGGRCDWNDKEVREDGTTVVGYNYPSIDHVIPLAKGGEHSWANVKLAHVICNIHKRDN